MRKQITQIFVIVVLQLMMVVALTTGVFAAEPVGATVTTITGRVWLDVTGHGDADQTENAVVNAPVFIQRLDGTTPDAEMTMVAYTDEIGGFSLVGLEAGTYQIWTDVNTDSIYYLVVTIDDATPTATAELPVVAHRVFMPTVMR